MTTYLNEKARFLPFIHAKPSGSLGLVVVIPCHDEDFLLLSLLSLHRCDRPPCDVEVIVVVNEREDAAPALVQKNRTTAERAAQWAAENNRPHLKFHVIHPPGLPRKHAGVGLARKIGMDEACYRLEKTGHPRGIIACFDADTRCERNYLQALFEHFQNNPKAQACGIYFEHPLSGPDFDEEVYEAIAGYELHLRYYVEAQRWAGIPHAWLTIGSSMAVRCDAYQQQGGMNRRQAGEDFYFLHKFIPLGHFSEITSTKTIPSPRPSHRVPFGTGRAVGEMLKNGQAATTYNPLAFKDLSALVNAGLSEIGQVEGFQAGLPVGIRDFLTVQGFSEKWAEIKANTAGEAAFLKRFWRWFDGFMVMKYVHFVREHHYPDVPTTEAAEWLLGELQIPHQPGPAPHLLGIFRNLAKRSDYRART